MLVGNVAWTITGARQANKLTSPSGTTKEGNFVIVDFTFTNNNSEAITLGTRSLTLIDSQGRKSEADPDVFEFIDPNRQIFLKQVNPGVQQSGEAIYTVANDASGFQLQAGDASPFSNTNAHINLGF